MTGWCQLPELPEVQTIVDALSAAGIVGRRIIQARVRWDKTIATPSPQLFRRKIKGVGIQHIRRRAKYIIMDLTGKSYLVVHLRMTGRFDLVAADQLPTPHVHVILALDDGRKLMFHDTRKFGRFYLTTELSSITQGLGPEPLSPHFSAKVLSAHLSKRQRQIKPLLLDQRFISGLGNIYVDEALWHAGIHPLRQAHTLDGGEVRSLHRAIRHVLRQGIRNAGTSLGRGLGNYMGLNANPGRNGDHLKVFRKTGQTCPRCGGKIQRIVVGQRGTHLCTMCQI